MDTLEYDPQEEREQQAKIKMLEAFDPLPEAIRTEIKLRIAVEGAMRGGLAQATMTQDCAFMEKCAIVARLFLLGLRSS